jgi:hypothetical protein
MTQKNEAKKKYLQAKTRAGREIYEKKGLKPIEFVEGRSRIG